MVLKNQREKEDLESPRPRRVKHQRKMAPNQNPRGRDLPKRIRIPPLKMVTKSQRMATKSQRMARRSQTRLNTERKVRVINSPRSHHLLKLRRLLPQMEKISQRRKREDLKLPRTQRCNTAQRVLLLKRMRRPPQIPQLGRRKLQRKRKRLQKILFIRTQWNLSKRENSSPSGRNIDMVIGERAQVRLS